MSIKPLPGDVVAQIKSSVVINTLNNVICGLIKNSLDAKASRINVSLDYSRGNCSVEDDGIGILPSEFTEGGFLGQLHSTSKLPPRTDLYGRNGIFLASVAALSLLSVTSHHESYYSHNSLSIHNSKVIARHTPALPEQRVLTFPHGTRVTVRDLFGSMPVRVKHRALQATKGFSSREWDQLVLDVLAILIAWPGAVSISIREASSRQSLSLKTRAASIHQTTSELDHVSRMSNLLQQTSLFDVNERDLWISLGASGPGIYINGCVCLVPVATKRTQFISFGIEPLSNEGQRNLVYEEINRIFANSAFGALEAESGSEGDERNKTEGLTARELKSRKGVDRWPVFSLSIDLKRYKAKGETGISDIVDGREKTLSEIVDLVKAMFHEFLKKHHFRPKAVSLSMTDPSRDKSEKSDGSRSRIGTPLSRPRSLRRQELKIPSRSREPSDESSPARPAHDVQQRDHVPNRPPSPFDSWSRVKAGRALPSFKPSASDGPSLVSSPPVRSAQHGDTEEDEGASVAELPTKPSLFDSSGKLTRAPFEDINIEAILNSETSKEKPATPTTEPAKETFVWVNPMTKRALVVNSRTGFVMDRHKSNCQSPAILEKPRTTKRLPKHPEYSVSADQDSVWVDNLLAKWKNPVFELTETPIPRLPNTLEPIGLDSDRNGYRCHEPNYFSASTSHETSAMVSQGRLSRNSLRNAKLIAQVDNKFILAKIQPEILGRKSSPSDTASHSLEDRLFLVLIDQHAADERCRVESLMKEYFERNTSAPGKSEWKPRVHILDKPLHFEVSTQDRDLLSRHRSLFGHWGITYELRSDVLQSKSKSKSSTGLSVTGLPPSISERCKSEPRLVVELLRKEAWRMNDEPTSFYVGPVSEAGSQSRRDSEMTDDNEHSWVSKFHGCPQGILDLINSRACRSAIMFNDPLSMDELRSWTSINDTLLDLGSNIGDAMAPYEESSLTSSSFAQAFKEWKETP